MTMTRFVSETDTKTIDLGEGDQVEFYSKASYGMLADLNDLTMKKSEKGALLLARMIKSWNLKDAEGNEVPCTLENIKKLDMDTVVLLNAEVEKMFPNLKKNALPSEEQ